MNSSELTTPPANNLIYVKLYKLVNYIIFKCYLKLFRDDLRDVY